jgi:hypothetical protein
LDEAEDIGCARRRLVLGQFAEVRQQVTFEGSGLGAELAHFGCGLDLGFGECIHGLAELGHLGFGLGLGFFGPGLGSPESIHGAVELGRFAFCLDLGFGECGHNLFEAENLAIVLGQAFVGRHGLWSFSALVRGGCVVHDAFR